MAINRINFAQNFMDKNKENFYAKAGSILAANNRIELGARTFTKHQLPEQKHGKGRKRIAGLRFNSLYRNGSAINRVFRDVFTAS